MPPEAIPPSVEQFIWRHIPSVGQLEILCVLWQDSRRKWSVPDLRKELQSSEEAISACLRRFIQAGFVAMDEQERYVYAPASPQLAETVDAVVKTYRERRVTVIELIYQRPSDSIQGFADAFRFKQDN